MQNNKVKHNLDHLIASGVVRHGKAGVHAKKSQKKKAEQKDKYNLNRAVFD